MPHAETAPDLNSYNNAAVEIEPVPHRFREALGIMAVRATAIVGAAATMLGVSYAAEAATETEPQAQAYVGEGYFYATNSEQSWCRWPSRWDLCNKTSELSGIASSASNDFARSRGLVAPDGKPQAHNNIVDAVRHCYWNALMAREFGADTAKGFGDRHEDSPKQKHDEWVMDLHNNQKGRDWATDPNPRQRCIDGADNDELITWAAS